VYNALGQLIEKSGNGGTTLLMYDEAGHLLGEYSSTGALVQETIWMGDIPVATLRPNGSAVAVYYVHTDHLGTPRKIRRPSDNALMWRWGPDTFGSVAPSGSLTYNLRFPGQYYLAESGLHYNYFRTYDPQTGRYLESDPIGLAAGSLSTYAYAAGNPIRFVDPTGLIALPGDPSGLPPGWKQDPSHLDPNGERWTNGTDVLDFNRGRRGLPGWRGKDHWHLNGGKKHLSPGEQCPTADDPAPDAAPDPTAEPVPTIDPETKKQITQGVTEIGAGALFLRFLLTLFAET